VAVAQQFFKDMRTPPAFAAACLLFVGAPSASAQIPLEVLHTVDRHAEGAGSLGLVQASDGNFYGMTYYGPDLSCCGTIYQVTPQGALAVLHRFTSDDEYSPRSPTGRLVQARDGHLYGFTESGGRFGWGVIFRMALDGTFTVLHDFEDSRPGGGTALVQAADGYLYGTTFTGGAWNLGTAFRISLDGVFVTLHEFAGGPDDSVYPGTDLVEASGAFYGVAYSSQSQRVGVIYRMTPQGDVTMLQSFSTFDGDYSHVGLLGLVLASDGNLYGTTHNTAKGLVGLFYRLTLSGDFTVLAKFPSYPSGEAPGATIVEGPDGNFYSGNSRQIFQLSPGGRITATHTFEPGLSGWFFSGWLVRGLDRNLYGVTEDGAGKGGGAIFRLWLSLTKNDLDATGNADVLWRHSDGTVAAWLTDGGSGNISTVDPTSTRTVTQTSCGATPPAPSRSGS
jgi:uncharacterized repeat protein (TIGR03803 family)